MSEILQIKSQAGSAEYWESQYNNLAKDYSEVLAKYGSLLIETKNARLQLANRPHYFAEGKYARECVLCGRHRFGPLHDTPPEEIAKHANDEIYRNSIAPELGRLRKANDELVKENVRLNTLWSNRTLLTKQWWQLTRQNLGTIWPFSWFRKWRR